jgi:hypothetical protein
MVSGGGGAALKGWSLPLQLHRLLSPAIARRHPFFPYLPFPCLAAARA